MKKLWQLWLTALLTLGLLSACNEDNASSGAKVKQNDEVNNEQVFPVTVKDARGNDVTLQEAPDRIVSLTPSNTEILFSLGLDEEIVGVNDNDNYPEQVAEKTSVGGMEFNIETIISLQPDIVFAHESSMYMMEGAIDQLVSAGIKIFVVKDAMNFEETYKTIEEIGTLTGKEDEAEKVTKDIQNKLAEIQAKVKGQEPKTAFIVVGTQPDIYVVGQNNFMNEMLKAINVTNAVEVEGWPMYSAEEFVDSNPDSIIFTYAGDDEVIKNNKAFSVMKAVQSNSLTVVDGDTTSRQGPRLALGVEALAKAIYPEAFNE
ncbi:ABC transporter substrate-binding protein [Lysinibacillus sp. 54212]|uniref:ABC transporter substrate-binding protein n=1 Tax=Lysinibacillus sp. 54212 TaxID=3119829 RepID=UPI002FC76C7F